MHFTFKTCQIVADTSMTTQFHEFFECKFWRIFAICPECASTAAINERSSFDDSWSENSLMSSSDFGRAGANYVRRAVDMPGVLFYPHILTDQLALSQPVGQIIPSILLLAHPL